MKRKITFDLKHVMTSIDENLKSLKEGINPMKLSPNEKDTLLNDLNDLEKLARSVKEVLKQA